jgi:type I restriction enzyme S subunit
MTPHDLIAAFETLAEAPAGVERLRELILELAVRGRLVPQDPSDEPATTLVERIAAEEARGLRGGKGSKCRTPEPISDDERTLDIPDNWSWVRLREAAHDLGQTIPKRAFTYIDVGSIDNQRGSVADELAIIEAAHAPSRARKLVMPGTVIYSTVRPYLMNIAVITRDYVPGPIASTAFAVLHPYDGVESKLLFHWLRSPFFTRYVTSQMKGVAYPAINDASLLRAPLPLPPIAEQHRIVARVDELMALLDRLEGARTTRDGARAAVRDSTLAALREADSLEEVEVAWNRFAERIDDLVIDPSDIAPLRQAVLELAVRGRLVAQDRSEEPACVRLGERLLSTTPEAAPFTLPTGWAWSSIAKLGTIVGGGTPSKDNPVFWNGRIPWVTPKDMKRDIITDSQDHVSDAALTATAIKRVPPESLLVVVRGMILAHSFPTALTAAEVTVNQDMKALVPFDPTLGRYLLVATKGLKLDVLRLVERSTHGTCKLPSEKIFGLPLPIPPWTEQQRIVARVDELMALLDHLEERLASARTAHAAFAAAAVHSVANGVASGLATVAADN